MYSIFWLSLYNQFFFLSHVAGTSPLSLLFLRWTFLTLFTGWSLGANHLLWEWPPRCHALLTSNIFFSVLRGWLVSFLASGGTEQLEPEMLHGEKTFSWNLFRCEEGRHLWECKMYLWCIHVLQRALFEIFYICVKHITKNNWSTLTYINNKSKHVQFHSDSSLSLTHTQTCDTVVITRKCVKSVS